MSPKMLSSLQEVERPLPWGDASQSHLRQPPLLPGTSYRHIQEYARHLYNSPRKRRHSEEAGSFQPAKTRAEGSRPKQQAEKSLLQLPFARQEKSQRSLGSSLLEHSLSQAQQHPQQARENDRTQAPQAVRQRGPRKRPPMKLKIPRSFSPEEQPEEQVEEQPAQVKNVPGQQIQNRQEQVLPIAQTVVDQIPLRPEAWEVTPHGLSQLPEAKEAVTLVEAHQANQPVVKSMERHIFEARDERSKSPELLEALKEAIKDEDFLLDVHSVILPQTIAPQSESLAAQGLLPEGTAKSSDLASIQSELHNEQPAESELELATSLLESEHESSASVDESSSLILELTSDHFESITVQPELIDTHTVVLPGKLAREAVQAASSLAQLKPSAIEFAATGTQVDETALRTEFELAHNEPMDFISDPTGSPPEASGVPSELWIQEPKAESATTEKETRVSLITDQSDTVAPISGKVVLQTAGLSSDLSQQTQLQEDDTKVVHPVQLQKEEGQKDLPQNITELHKVAEEDQQLAARENPFIESRPQSLKWVTNELLKDHKDEQGNLMQDESMPKDESKKLLQDTTLPMLQPETQEEESPKHNEPKEELRKIEEEAVPGPKQEPKVQQLEAQVEQEQPKEEEQQKEEEAAVIEREDEEGPKKELEQQNIVSTVRSGKKPGQDMESLRLSSDTISVDSLDLSRLNPRIPLSPGRYQP